METYIIQFRKLWSELGANQKVSILLSVVGVIAGMGIMLMWAGRPQMELLFGRLDPTDMAEIIAALDEQEIKYEIKNNGTAIYVEPERVHPLRMKLAQAGIPKGGGVGFEIFDRGNFGISDFVQRTNYVRAIQGELSRTIGQLRGVRSARVMIVIPENKLLLDRAPTVPTASVFVDTAGTMLPESSINSIRFLVANSVEGLNVNDVAVVDNNGHVLSEKVKTDETLGLASTQLKFRQDLEKYYTDKVETMLSRVLGAGQVVARVSVDVQTDASTTVEEVYDPEGQVVREQTSTEDSVLTSEVNPRQVVGIAGNAPEGEDQAPDPNASNTTNEETKNKTVTYEINKTTRETISRPGSVKNISAAVFIAMRYDSESEESKPRSQQEIDKLTTMVANALGQVDQQGTIIDPKVTIDEVAFMANPLEAMVNNELQNPIFKWLEMGRNFIAVGVAVIMFVVFLKMLKHHKVAPINIEVIEDDIALPEVEGAMDVAPRATPEILNELIQKKPENVSTALKKWMEASNK